MKVFSNQVQPGSGWAVCHLSHMLESLLNQMIKDCDKKGRYLAKPSQTVWTFRLPTVLIPHYLFCSSAEFSLAFPLALYVPLIHSALQKKNSHNQESIKRHNAVHIKSHGSVAFSLEYQFISKLFSALHLPPCFVKVHCCNSFDWTSDRDGFASCE